MAKKATFVESLHLLLEKTDESEEISLRQIFVTLAGKGYAALLILFSLPFCFPITIPGFSTPFGLVLCFLGLRVAFGKKLWWPKWILEKKVSSANVRKVTEKTIQVVKKMHKIMHPRLFFLTRNGWTQRLHGLLVFFLAIILSLPLPIPFSNMLSALPILFIGLGLLEDDGLFILIGYALAAICFAAFASLFVLGKKILMQIG